MNWLVGEWFVGELIYWVDGYLVNEWVIEMVEVGQMSGAFQWTDDLKNVEVENNRNKYSKTIIDYLLKGQKILSIKSE